MSRLDRFVSGISDVLLGYRRLLAAIFAAMTIAFGISATRVQLDPGFASA